MKAKSKLFVGAVLCGILVLFILARPPKAQALVPPIITGTFGAFAQISPGFTLASQNQTVTGTGNFGNLVSTISLGTIVSATFLLHGTGSASCLSIDGSGTVEVDWRDANNMVVAHSTVVASAAAGTALVPVLTGVVTDGSFEGATVLPIFGTAAPNGLCGILFGPTTFINFTGQVAGYL